MKFLEKDLENHLCSLTDHQMIDSGLYVSGKIKRQLLIKNYGIADMVMIQKESVNFLGDIRSVLSITVIELKKGKIDMSAYLQSIRYCYGIKEYLENRNFYLFYLNIALIGKNIADGNFKFIPKLHNPVTLIPNMGSVNSVDLYEYKVREDSSITFHFKA